MIRAQTVRVPNRRKPLSTTQKILRACAILWLLLVSPFAAYWAVQNYLHEADRLRPAPAAAAPVVSPTPTAAVPTPTAAYYLPDLSQPDRWPDQQLAFVREGNIWLAKIILDKDLRDEWLQKNLRDPWQVTRGWQAITYIWSPRGDYIAAFDGSTVYYVNVPPDRAEPQPGYVQEHMNIPSPQTSTIPSMMWTPDGSRVILWNIQNPRRDMSVGWFFLDPSRPKATPQLNAGRIVKMLALSDGSLFGIVTKPCPQEPCPLDLLRYNSETKIFLPFYLDEFRRKGSLGSLSAASWDILEGAAVLECGFSSGSGPSLALGQRSFPAPSEGKDMPYDFMLSPDGLRVLVARGVACNGSIPAEWLHECWPGGGPVHFDLSFWDGKEGKPISLDVTGAFINWAPDSRWAAFQSCLASTPSRALDYTETAPPWVYVVDTNVLIEQENKPHEAILPVSNGCLPSWRPPPP